MNLRKFFSPTPEQSIEIAAKKIVGALLQGKYSRSIIDDVFNSNNTALQDAICNRIETLQKTSDQDTILRLINLKHTIKDMTKDLIVDREITPRSTSNP